jgi:hypothetical protein
MRSYLITYKTDSDSNTTVTWKGVPYVLVMNCLDNTFMQVIVRKTQCNRMSLNFSTVSLTTEIHVFEVHTGSLFNSIQFQFYFSIDPI